MVPCAQAELSASCVKSMWTGSTSISHVKKFNVDSSQSKQGLGSNPHRSIVNEREKHAKKFSPVNSFQMSRFSQVWCSLEGDLPSLVLRAELLAVWVWGHSCQRERYLCKDEMQLPGGPLAKPLSCRKRRRDAGAETSWLGEECGRLGPWKWWGRVWTPQKSYRQSSILSA